MAEGRGKAQADTLRRARTETMANRLANGGGAVVAPAGALGEALARVPAGVIPKGVRLERVAATALRKNDLVFVHAGEFIPADGEIVEGVAWVDESAITGESAPVIRESGGDRSAVTAGTRVISDWLKVRITSDPGQTFLDRMIALVEGAERQKTPNEIALNILLAVLTLVFLLVVVTLRPMAEYAGTNVSMPVLIALLVCLIPTTIGALISAIGIAGMDRLVQHNVLAMSGRAVEAAGDVDTLLLDKTGTITLGNRQATEFLPAEGVTEGEMADAAQLASLADETPEGRSIVVLAKEKYRIRGRELTDRSAAFVAFSAETRMSGVDLNGRRDPEGRCRRDCPVRRRQRGPGAGRAAGGRGPHRAVGRDAAGGRGRAASAWGRAPEGHREGRHAAAFRGAAVDGHPDHHDHGGQPADRGVDRERGRCGRLPRRGDARGQDGPHPAGAGPGQAGGHDG